MHNLPQAIDNSFASCFNLLENLPAKFDKEELPHFIENFRKEHENNSILSKIIAEFFQQENLILFGNPYLIASILERGPELFQAIRVNTIMRRYFEFIASSQPPFPEEKISFPIFLKRYCLEVLYTRNEELHTDLGESNGAWTCAVISLNSCYYISKYQPKTAVRSYENEAKVLSRLNHPNIAQFISFEPNYNLNQEEIKLEYGGRKFFDERFEAHPTDANRWIHQVLSALTYLHGHKIVHNNIQSSSIRIDALGNVKLCSFKHYRSFGERGQFRNLLYISPEAYRGNPLDDKSDMWSLAILIYQLFVPHYLVPHPISSMYFQDLMPFFQTMGNHRLPKYNGDEIVFEVEKSLLLLDKQVIFYMDPHAQLLTIVQACLKWDPNMRPNAQDLLEFMNGQ